jgi:hypothetical protein
MRMTAESFRGRARLATIVAMASLVLIGCGTGGPAREPSPDPVEPRDAEGEMPEETQPAPSRASSPAVTTAPTVVEIPTTGNGAFAVASGQSGRVGTGRLIRYTVEVEEGLPFSPADVASVVDATLADPRSWIGSGEHAFERTSTDGDVRVLLATPTTTDALCEPLRTRGEVSCRNGDMVVINARRWAFGIDAYGDDLAAYRQYVVNHEMGHAIGFGHVSCPGSDELAPVMLQQTYGLDGCLPNPWPFP